ncbi:MAG: DUF3108 domain-containing protein [Ignavibacteriales bacterium]|nr:MAG: DUF3108 domain-containing protein [Ignavibacteriales bacterium]
MMSKVLLVFILFSFISFSFTGTKQKVVKKTVGERKNDKCLVVGEELLYEVSYSFIKLGTVRIKVLDKKNIGGVDIYKTIGYIDSYSGVPFVDLHQVYESSIFSDFTPQFFRGTVKDEKYSSYTEYFFDKKKSLIHVKKGKVKPPQVWTDSTTSLDRPYQDGLSIFFYARYKSGSTKSQKVPCYVKEEKVFTNINFYNEVEDVSIDAVDYDINCVRLDGEMDFISIFGLTGYFEGWFSNDEAAIPIVAKMHVIIGSITLELIEWKRQGWMPPKFNN